MSVQILTAFLVLYGIFSKTQALKCYTCSTTEDTADQSCATDVVSMGTSAITDCDKKYCTIIRVEYKDPPGKLQSFGRNCIDKLVNKDGRTDDFTYITYTRSCQTDLCNVGNGRAESTSAQQYLGDKSTIYVLGIKNGAAKMTSVLCMIFGCMLVLLAY